MKFLLFSIILYATGILSTESPTKNYTDPNDEDGQVILWTGLFTKLNGLLVEIDKINKNLLDLNKRQEVQGVAIAKLVENAHLNSKYLNESRLEFTARQEDQGVAITKLVENIHLNTKYLNESRLEFNSRLDGLNKNQENLKIQLSKLMEDVELIAKAQNSSLLKSQIGQASDNIDKQMWTTILRRQDGSVNFYRNWTDYKNGFGNPPNGEFFIGLEKLHQITTQGVPQELTIILKDWKNETRTANYDLFQVGGESEKYFLKELGKFSGDAKDSLEYHKGKAFSTVDHNDNNSCAEQWKGAWWFGACYYSHLFGPYKKEQEALTKGVGWAKWKGHDYSLQFVEMKIRPKLL